MNAKITISVYLKGKEMFKIQFLALCVIFNFVLCHHSDYIKLSKNGGYRNIVVVIEDEILEDLKIIHGIKVSFFLNFISDLYFVLH